MPNKKSIILESVRKLIALDLSDEEIIRNLIEVGLSEKDARAILDEVKGVKKKPKAVEKPLPKPEPKQEPESSIGEKFPESEEALMRELAEGLGEEKPRSREQPSKKAVSETERAEWEKTVMKAVNERVEEMKKLKAELDSVLEQRIRAGLDSEYKKISALINSKTVLMSEKINADLEKKHKEIDELLDKRVKEVLEINEEIKKNLSDMSEWEKKYKAVQEEIKDIEKTIQAVRAGGLKELEGKSKKSVEELLALIKRANDDLKAFIAKTKKEIEAEKISASSEISQLGSETLKSIRTEAEQARGEIKNEKGELLKELREEEEKRIKELSLELEQKRDATIEKLDEIVEERLDLTQKAFRELKDKLLSDVETGSQESRAEITEFIAKAQAEMKRLDSRVTKTLELESEVIEDIMNEAKEKIERVKLESQRDLEAKINEQVRALKILQSKIDPERASKKIAELERTKDKIRKEISRKITEKVQGIDKEYAQKIKLKLQELDKTISESNKKLDLIIASADKKAKELEFIDKKMSSVLESRLREFEKEYNEKIRPKVEELEKMKIDIISSKERLITQMNSENMKFKQEMKNSVAKYEGQLNALTREATLLINQKERILKGLEPYSQMDLEKIKKYVLDSTLKGVQASIRLSTRASVEEIQKAKEEAKKEVLQSIGVDQIQAQIKQLNLFKQQFLKAIDKNIEQFNKRIQKFNETTKQMEDHFNTRVKMIDQKMDELDHFEKNFARAIGASLEKMAKANAAKTDKK